MLGVEHGKPLKRFRTGGGACVTGLKPGVNERLINHD